MSLSLGARQKARAKVIVKRLSASEDFGGMGVLCTDKTGTLTRGTVGLAGAVDLNGRRSPRVLEAAYLNALHQTGFGNPSTKRPSRPGTSGPPRPRGWASCPTISSAGG